jgi:hypothetical protein
MEIFIVWLILSSVVAVMGDSRKIGSFNAFFLSIFLSPLVGLVFTLSSKRNDTIAFEKALLEKQTNNYTNYIDELYKLQKLYESNSIDEEFYNSEKARLVKHKVTDRKVVIYDSKNRNYEIRINNSNPSIKIKSTIESGYEFYSQQNEFVLTVIPKNIFFNPRSYKINLSREENIIDIAGLLK